MPTLNRPGKRGDRGAAGAQPLLSPPPEKGRAWQESWVGRWASGSDRNGCWGGGRNGKVESTGKVGSSARGSRARRGSRVRRTRRPGLRARGGRSSPLNAPASAASSSSPFSESERMGSSAKLTPLLGMPPPAAAPASPQVLPSWPKRAAPLRSFSCCSRVKCCSANSSRSAGWCLSTSTVKPCSSSVSPAGISMLILPVHAEAPGRRPRPLSAVRSRAARLPSERPGRYRLRARRTGPPARLLRAAAAAERAQPGEGWQHLQLLPLLLPPPLRRPPPGAPPPPARPRDPRKPWQPGGREHCRLSSGPRVEAAWAWGVGLRPRAPPELPERIPRTFLPVPRRVGAAQFLLKLQPPPWWLFLFLESNPKRNVRGVFC
jgi:hypothetical protein